jgi:hypothetical protein
MSGLYISRGSCTVLFAYDIGFGISLDRAERMLASSVQGKTQREYLRHARKSPQSFEYRPSPLRFTRKAAPVAVGACATDATVSLTLYDFGAVSVAYTIPLEGTLDQLAALSEQLYDNKDPRGGFPQARQRVAARSAWSRGEARAAANGGRLCDLPCTGIRLPDGDGH